MSKSNTTQEDFSFRQYAWAQFKKNKPALISFYIFLALIFFALFADVVANHRPLYAEYKGVTMYPAFASMVQKSAKAEFKDPKTGQVEELVYDHTDWKQVPLDKVVWAPIPFSPNKADQYNRDYVAPSDVNKLKLPDGSIVDAPFRFRHHLGTDQRGVDLLSGLIHGIRIALKVGIISVLISAIIGIILGSLAGYYGDDGLKIPRFAYWLTWIGVVFGVFYGFMVRSAVIKEAFNDGLLQVAFQTLISLVIFVGIAYLFYQLGKWISKLLPSFLSEPVNAGIDSIISRSIEILNSIPRILLIISVASLTKEKSLALIMVILGLTSWTGIARFTRAEFLRTKNLEFIQASKALGYSELRTIFVHALPNSFAPVFIDIAFSIATAILAESGLSFLGIGVPDDLVTWGSLLTAARQQIEAWWLVLFPGTAIFITVTIFNLMGEGLRDALDPKLKQ